MKIIYQFNSLIVPTVDKLFPEYAEPIAHESKACFARKYNMRNQNATLNDTFAHFYRDEWFDFMMM